MKRAFLAIALVSALCVSACAPSLLAAIGIKPSAQATVHLDAGKALLLAKTGLDGAVQIVDDAVVAKAISKANAEKASGYLTQARTVLDNAEASYHASASYDPTSSITTVSCLIAAAQNIAGKPTTATGCPAPGN